MIEAVALAAALTAAGLVVFGPPTVRDNLPIVPSTPIVLAIPLFGWAAMRFGVGGVSTALLLLAAMASVRGERR